MNERQYKLYTTLYVISGSSFLISFFAALFTFSFSQSSKITINFVILSIIALVSLIYFVWFWIWSVTNKVGREYWTIYFKKKSLKFKHKDHLFKTAPGEHAADKMKKIIMGLVIFITIFTIISIELS